MNDMQGNGTSGLDAAPRPHWAEVVVRQFTGYTPAALCALLALWLGGALALAWALSQMLRAHDQTPWLHFGLGLAGVAAAAAFPVKLPRTTYNFTAADAFIFMILATIGPAAAVLAAGLEGIVAGWRARLRALSRVAAPASAMLGMGCAGQIYEAVIGAEALRFLGAEPTQFLALCLGAPVCVLLTSGPIYLVHLLRRSGTSRWASWMTATTVAAAMMLGSAALAGVVIINAERFGAALMVLAAAVALVVVGLLRVALARVEAEHRAQAIQVEQAQHEARLNEERFASAFTHAAIGMVLAHADGGVLQVNAAATTLLDRGEDDLLGAEFNSLLHPGDAVAFARRAQAVEADPDTAFSMELRITRRDGEVRWVALHCSSTADPEGQGRCLIHQLVDITARQAAETQLEHIAYHDSLTDLANRRCFNERLAAAVERSRVDAQCRFAVLYLDLDRFKLVNDSMGHMAGNTLLREVAQRVQACTRDRDLVARLGGDEFAVLLEDLHDADDARCLADRLLAALALPLPLQGNELITGASIGLTFSDLGYRSADEALRDADLAMYEAKAAGRGRAVVFDASMHQRISERMSLEPELRRAIAAREIGVHCQPLYDLSAGRIIGFEALARWDHPQRGAVSPAVFVGLAEESGQMAALTGAVLERALAQLAQWRAAHPAAHALSLNINISSQDLARADLADEVCAALQRHALPPQVLTLEITETMLMSRLDIALATIARIAELGVRISLDDFGTGYSSLAYLSTLPFDSLKIDRSFVKDLERSPQNVEIVRAIVTLAGTLGRKVVAEGIETAAQLNTLRGLGVGFGQGFLLSRPLGPEQVDTLLGAGNLALV